MDSPERSRLLLSEEDESGFWREDLRGDALFALDRAEARLGVALDQPPRVQSISPEEKFYKTIGQRPHHLLAVAMAPQNLVLINRERFSSMSRGERRATMVHEFAHLIIGRRIPTEIPRWLNEGLAMVAAEEHGFAYHSRLVIAATFGRILPLSDLWSGGDEELAYAESLDAARFFLSSGAEGKGKYSDDPAPLVRKLADPREGAALRKLLADPNFTDGFERRWRESLKSFWTWLAVLSGGGVFWLAVTLLFLLAYWLKRRRGIRIEERWREEEQLLGGESSSVSEIEEIEEEE